LCQIPTLHISQHSSPTLYPCEDQSVEGKSGGHCIQW
jgi:hypothetical protein